MGLLGPAAATCEGEFGIIRGMAMKVKKEKKGVLIGTHRSALNMATNSTTVLTEQIQEVDMYNTLPISSLLLGSFSTPSLE